MVDQKAVMSRSEERRLAIQKPDFLAASLDFIAVPRAWIARNGWPHRFIDLKALVGAQTEGFQAARLTKHEAVSATFGNGNGLAYFYEGPEGQSFLYAQGWRGAA